MADEFEAGMENAPALGTGTDTPQGGKDAELAVIDKEFRETLSTLNKGESQPETTTETESEPTGEESIEETQPTEDLKKYGLKEKSVEELAGNYKALRDQYARDAEFLKLVIKHRPDEFNRLVGEIQAEARGMLPPKKEEAKAPELPPEIAEQIGPEALGALTKWLDYETQKRGILTQEAYENRQKEERLQQSRKDAAKGMEEFRTTWIKRLTDQKTGVDFARDLEPLMFEVAQELELPEDTILTPAKIANLFNLAVFKLENGKRELIVNMMNTPTNKGRTMSGAGSGKTTADKPADISALLAKKPEDLTDDEYALLKKHIERAIPSGGVPY